jgi:hypothetical protein
VRLLATIDAALDKLLYRPAVVKLFCWLPRWWQCDLARASMIPAGRPLGARLLDSSWDRS